MPEGEGYDIFSPDLIQFLSGMSKHAKKPTTEFVDDDAAFDLQKGPGAGSIPPGLEIQDPQRMIRVAPGNGPNTHARVSQLQPTEPNPTLEDIIGFLEAAGTPIPEEPVDYQRDYKEFQLESDPTTEQARRADVAAKVLTSQDGYKRVLSSGEVIGHRLPQSYDYEIPITRENQFNQPTRLTEFDVLNKRPEIILNIEEKIIPKKLASDASLEFLQRKFGL